MSSSSAIEWTDATWNPVTGCDRVSPGCAHCYALELAPRLRRFAQARGGGKWADTGDGGKSSGPAFGVTLHPAELEQPLRWRKPRRVFVNSMSDLFHDEVPLEYIARVWAVMEQAPQHVFQVLTKRPERMHEVVRSWRFCKAVAKAKGVPCHSDWLRMYDEPLSNVWLGVSIENRRYVERAAWLRDTPAAVRFISAEPLLGPLVVPPPHAEDQWPGGRELDLRDIDWLIVGGESGSRARRIDPDWVRDLRDAAASVGTAFFLKQWGGRTPKAGGRELDGRTWDEMPPPGGARAVPRGQEAIATS